MVIEYAAWTDRGTARPENQDRILANGIIASAGGISGSAADALFAAVCDGIGSCSGGALAAQTASEVLALYADTLASEISFRRALLCANDAIRSQQRKDPRHAAMSTTAAGLLIRGNTAFSFNVGDSRIYRYAGGRLELLSADHTCAWDVYQAGRISGPRTVPDPHCHGVTRYLGGRDALCAPTFRCRPVPEDGCLYLICSDGVWGRVSESELSALLCRRVGLREKSRAVSELALRSGSTDDRSIILVRCR